MKQRLDMNRKTSFGLLTMTALLLLSITRVYEYLITNDQTGQKPLIIGHRGASAYRPEHTLESYSLAIDLGADIIEPDLVFTKDGHLLARHENYISTTTNVADLPIFSKRVRSKVVDGESLTGFFTEDFTLAELRQLRARERIPIIRPNNTKFNDQFTIPTFQEVIDLVNRKSKETGREIGIYPEIKHPSYFESLGYDFIESILQVLRENGLDNDESKIYIQCFEVSTLQQLAKLTKVKLVQLLGWTNSQPYDFVLHGINKTTEDMITPNGLKEIAEYADIVAPYKEWVIPWTAAQTLGTPTPFVEDARKVGLDVHIYTMRPENIFLPNEYRIPGTELTHGKSAEEILAYLKAGVVGVFSDAPEYGRKAVDHLNQ